MDWVAPNFIGLPENWKPVPEFEGVYEVSDLGRVRNLAAYHRWKPGRLLKTFDDGHGYLMVFLYNDEGRINKKLHRLVAETFIPNPLNLPQVNHKGPKHDCRVSMLEWCTKRQNENYAVKMRQRGDGVYLDKKSQKWIAHYSPAPYTKTCLGAFNSKEKALKARQNALEEK